MSENVFQKRLLSSPGNSPRSRKRVALEEIKGVQLNIHPDPALPAENTQEIAIHPSIHHIYNQILNMRFDSDDVRELSHRLATLAHKLERDDGNRNIDSFRKEMRDGFQEVNKSLNVVNANFKEVQASLNGDDIGVTTAVEKKNN